MQQRLSYTNTMMKEKNQVSSVPNPPQVTVSAEHDRSKFEFRYETRNFHALASSTLPQSLEKGRKKKKPYIAPPTPPFHSFQKVPYSTLNYCSHFAYTPFKILSQCYSTHHPWTLQHHIISYHVLFTLHLNHHKVSSRFRYIFFVT